MKLQIDCQCGHWTGCRGGIDLAELLDEFWESLPTSERFPDYTARDGADAFIAWFDQRETP